MVTYSTPAELVVGTTGANYISEDFGKVEINIPPDCYDHETTLKIKVMTYFPSIICYSISAVSTALRTEDPQDEHFILFYLLLFF